MQHLIELVVNPFDTSKILKGVQPIIQGEIGDKKFALILSPEDGGKLILIVKGSSLIIPGGMPGNKGYSISIGQIIEKMAECYLIEQENPEPKEMTVDDLFADDDADGLSRADRKPRDEELPEDTPEDRKALRKELNEIRKSQGLPPVDVD